MLSINSIEKGIVIDHIKYGMGYKISQLSKLDKADHTVTLVMNTQSGKLGRKDMIKIENIIDVDFDILGAFDDNMTVNVIENEKTKEKINLNLPGHLEGSIKCKNPRCITQFGRSIVQKFSLVDKETRTYKCDYCDHLYNVEE